MSNLAKFKPQRANANKHSERGLAALDTSIRNDGWMGAITTAADGETFDGSARVETLAEAMPSAEPIIVDIDGTRPVILRRTDIPDANDPRAKRLAVAANAIASMDWNPDGELLAQLAEEDEAIRKLIAQDDKALEAVRKFAQAAGQGDAEPQVDRAAELQVKWQTATDQLWQIGEHRLLCGDSTKRGEVERAMAGEKAEMVWTDPPYGVAVGDKNKYLNTIAPSNRVEENLENDDVSEPALIEMINASFDCAMAVCLAGGAWYIAAPAGPLHVLFGQALKERGIWHQTIQWVKNNATFSPMGVDYHWRAEPIFYGWLPGAGHRYYGGRKQDTVWEIDRPSKSPEHPTMKPVELVVRAVANSSQEGEIVYEPFAGSGTTLVACQNLSRKCRAIEISPAYCAVILERMATAFPDLEITQL